MPAPTPINIRYGDDGLLGAAAAQSGYGQGLLALRDRNQQLAAQQQGQDLNFIANNRAQLEQQAQFQQQQAASRINELKNAHDLRLQQLQGSSTPTSGYFEGNGSNPLAASIQKAKQAAVATKLNGINLPPDQQSMIDGLVNDQKVPYNQVEGVVDDIVRKSQSDRTAAQGAQRIKDQEAADKLRVQQQTQRESDIDQRSLRRSNVEGIDNEIGQLRRQEAALQRVVPPGATPSSFNPTVADPNLATARTEGFAGSLKDAAYGGGNLVTGGDQAGLQAFTELARVQRRISDLQAARQAQLQQEVGQAIVPGSDASGQAAGGSISIKPFGQAIPSNIVSTQPTTQPLTDRTLAAKYLQAAGGDKNKARQLAAQDGYTF